MKSFASDNYAGVLPEVMKALEVCNRDHAVSYGNDELTTIARKKFNEIFKQEVQIYFVFNGTGANVLSLSGCVESHQSILCAQSSHLYNDESTAPENFLGSRLVPVAIDSSGKILESALKENLKRKGDIHFAQPKLLSLTQTTEYGTIYTQNELKRFKQICLDHELYLHLDGARFFQAAAALNCSLAELSTEVGVDVLSLGGTKVGMMFGEAVVVFNKSLKERFDYKHKQVMQLSSKNRFIAAQFLALFNQELWRKSASHANQMAQILTQELKQFPFLKLTKEVEANAIFMEMPAMLYKELSDQFPFYVWNEQTGEVRLMCAFDTTEADIQKFITILRSHK